MSLVCWPASRCTLPLVFVFVFVFFIFIFFFVLSFHFSLLNVYYSFLPFSMLIFCISAFVCLRGSRTKIGTQHDKNNSILASIMENY